MNLKSQYIILGSSEKLFFLRIILWIYRVHKSISQLKAMDDDEGAFAVPGLAWSLLGYATVKQQLPEDDEELLGLYV